MSAVNIKHLLCTVAYQFLHDLYYVLPSMLNFRPFFLCVHCAKKPVTTMLTYPWKCTVLHCNHLGNTWKPLVLMTRHFDYCLSASEGDNQSVGSSAPVVSRCFPGGYNVKLYISRGRLAWWLLAFCFCVRVKLIQTSPITLYPSHLICLQRFWGVVNILQKDSNKLVL